MGALETKIIDSILGILNPQKIFQAKISGDSSKLVFNNEKHIPMSLSSKIHIIGLGKAASYEVRAVRDHLESLLPFEQIGKTLAYTKEGHILNDSRMIELEGSHPYMSEGNVKQTDIFISHLLQIKEDDIIVFLLSGGASSLLMKPVTSLEIDKLIKINRLLVQSGKNINEMNMVRKGMSEVKNGGLLKYIKSKNIIQFINCDIPNMELGDVGSGPLIYNDLNYSMINKFLYEHQVSLPVKASHIKEVHSFISSSAEKLINEFAETWNQEVFKGRIYDDILSNVLADMKKVLKEKSPLFFISGGEATINIPKSSGKGGRNTHFVLAFAQLIYSFAEFRNYKILSFGTDGGDGPIDAAGAYIDYSLFKNNEKNALSALENFDSYHFFEKINTLIKTGPTGTNVMDFRVIWRDELA